MDKMNKAKILERNEFEFDRLYQSYSKLVFFIAYQILRNREDAEDIMQETFITVYEKIDDFKGGNFKYWLLQITKNKARNLAIQKSKKKTKSKHEFDHVADEWVPFGRYGELIVKHFPQDVGKIIILRIVFDYSFEEIAEELQSTKTRIYRTFKSSITTLKYLLEDHLNE